MPTDLAVDTAALAAVSARLKAIAEALKSTPDQMRGYEGDLGDGHLADRLDHFINNWSEGRQSIIDDITQVCQYLDGAAQTYAGHDRAVAAALRGDGA